MKNNKELRDTLQELVDKLEMNNLTELRKMVDEKYKTERNKILNDTIEYLKEHSGTTYTANELASRTGLSVQSMSRGLLDARPSIDYTVKKVPVSYVRLDENGNVDFSHIISFNKKVGVYSL